MSTFLLGVFENVCLPFRTHTHAHTHTHNAEHLQAALCGSRGANKNRNWSQKYKKESLGCCAWILVSQIAAFWVMFYWWHKFNFFETHKHFNIKGEQRQFEMCLDLKPVYLFNWFVICCWQILDEAENMRDLHCDFLLWINWKFWLSTFGLSGAHLWVQKLVQIIRSKIEKSQYFFNSCELPTEGMIVAGPGFWSGRASRVFTPRGLGLGLRFFP